MFSLNTTTNATTPVTAFAFCNFDEEGIGFPRNCGPTEAVYGKWTHFHNARYGLGLSSSH